jgi:hypothetical protein
VTGIWVWVAESVTSIPGLVTVGIGLVWATVHTAVTVDRIDRAVAQWLTCHALWMGWDGRLKTAGLVDGEPVDFRNPGREGRWWTAQPARHLPIARPVREASDV